ncbi:MAG: ATP-binding protein, partial [Bacillota bacterium]|nr:ATP-binding protein [Bacillota bacterium]
QKEKDAIRDFLYDVSHQLKTPLTTLHLYADMDIAAAAGEQAETRAQDFLSLIVRMESLVQALLKLARLESGTTELHFAEQNLKMTAEQVVTSQLERLSMRRQSVRIIAQDPVMVRYDNQWLGEALQNILINAANHAPEDSEITLAINSTDTIATLSISDCGPGITAEDLPHLFDRFYRSRSPADGQGCGLGLALAAQVLQRHHGSIKAANRSEGGAIFTLTLPRYPLNVS